MAKDAKHEKPHLEHRTLDAKAVRKVLPQVNLEGIRLVYVHNLVIPDPGEIPESWGTDAYIGYDTHAHDYEPGSPSFRAGSLFTAAFDESWALDQSTPPERDPEEPPQVEIEAMFELSYSLKDSTGISQDDLEHFSFYNATFNAWPYWRELAQSLTLRMGLPPLIIPVFRVPELPAPRDSGSAPRRKSASAKK